MSKYDPDNMVRCQICFVIKHHSKYRRHLNSHLESGDVSKMELEEIIFQTKYAYKNIKKKIPRFRDGQICATCGKCVLDLANHLKKMHYVLKKNRIV